MFVSKKASKIFEKISLVPVTIMWQHWLCPTKKLVKFFSEIGTL